MTSGDLHLILASCAGIALSIWLIARIGFHPFFGLLCGALAIGVLAGLGPAPTVAAIEKGFGDILGGTGLVVALGLGLGTILQISGGAQALAGAIFRRTGERHAALGALAAALLLGLPLFFETGVVLLLPIIAAGIPAGDDRRRLTVMLSALAGLSVLHALLPPHPGPLVAAGILQAPVGAIIPIGLLAAIPTALVAGPLLARLTTHHVGPTDPPILIQPESAQASAARASVALLFPVVLIASGAVVRATIPGGGDAAAASGLPGVLLALADPVTALLLANLLALALLFPRRIGEKALHENIWAEAVRPAAGIVLSIGAGGSLKQVLVGAGLPQVFGKLADTQIASPLVIAWLVAAAIRVATGSATVATITAAGIMSSVVAGSAIPAYWFVLAIGTGSVFLSHVNDPGFWLVRGYLGTSVADTLRLWSTLETVIAVFGLLMVLLLHYASTLI